MPWVESADWQTLLRIFQDLDFELDSDCDPGDARQERIVMWRMDRHFPISFPKVKRVSRELIGGHLQSYGISVEEYHRLWLRHVSR